MSFTHSDITSYFSLLSVYYRDKYVAPDVIVFRLTSDDCGSAPCLICRQDSGNKESMNPGSSFSSPPTIVSTRPAWVILTTHKMSFPMEGFGDSEGGGKKTVRWSPYMEELDSSNSVLNCICKESSLPLPPQAPLALPRGNLTIWKATVWTEGARTPLSLNAGIRGQWAP